MLHSTVMMHINDLTIIRIRNRSHGLFVHCFCIAAHIHNEDDCSPHGNINNTLAPC